MKSKTKTHLLASLDRNVPMALSSAGIVMVFRRNLTDKEVGRAFYLFHLAATIETPDGYYKREDFPEAEMDSDTCADSPAERIYKVISQVCAGDKGLNLPEVVTS